MTAELIRTNATRIGNTIVLRIPISTEAKLCPWQIKDGCAPALNKNLFNISGINKEYSQKNIKDEIFDTKWDGSKPPDIADFLSNFYLDVSLVTDLGLIEANMFISKGKFVEVLWSDDLPEKDAVPPDGHYSRLVEVNFLKDYVRLIDPSNAKRLYDKNGYVITDINNVTERKWMKRKSYKMRIHDFVKRWRDTVDETGKIAEHLAIVVDPYLLR